MDREVLERLKALEDTQRLSRLKIINSTEFNEVSQLKTQCAILESQIEVLKRQNADLKATITILHPDTVSSKDVSIKDGWQDIPGIGKFPVKEIIDDGSFRV
jgi:SMC interacting uncharacterized protein involved in chromosome segregation